MAGYIGSKTSVVSSGVERKKTYSITGSTTSLTGLNYTVGKVHVFQNGVRLLDSTDYTATNGTSITLTVAAQSGDNVVVVSQASFQLSESYTSTESDARYVEVAGDTMTGNLNVTGTVTADGLTVDSGSVDTVATFESSGDAKAYIVVKDSGSSDGAFFGADGTHTIIGTGGNTERMRINSSGNVGIGTSSPSRQLHLSGSTPIIRLTDTDTNAYGEISSSSSDGNLMFFADQGNTQANTTIRFYVDASERMRIDSSGRVGIGTSSPSGELHVKASSGFAEAYVQGSSSSSGMYLFDQGTEAGLWKVDSGHLAFGTTNAERMRIDSSGNLLVGKTSADSATNGVQLLPNGISAFGRDGGEALRLNRNTSNGEILRFQKGGTTVGSIGVSSGAYLTIGTGDTGILFDPPGNRFYPCNASTQANRDNAIDVGAFNVRFDDVYATNGTIQTSDFNEKQDIASLTATEMLVGARISTLFKTFRWKDSVAENGDNARTHTGVIAQDVQAAFTAEGLDAGDYALFISSTWWTHDVDVPAVEAVAEVTDEDGNVTTEAVEAVDAYTRTDNYDTEAEAPEGATSKTRMGIRYPELLSFVAAYNEQRFASIEARLTALEA